MYGRLKMKIHQWFNNVMWIYVKLLCDCLWRVFFCNFLHCKWWMQLMYHVSVKIISCNPPLSNTCTVYSSCEVRTRPSMHNAQRISNRILPYTCMYHTFNPLVKHFLQLIRQRSLCWQKKCGNMASQSQDFKGYIHIHDKCIIPVQ